MLAGQINAAQQQHGCADDVFGDSQRIRAGGRDHLHPPRLACGNVNVVQAHTQSANDCGLRARRQQVAPYLGTVAHNDGISIGHTGHQAVGVIDKLWIVDNVETGAQRVYSRFVHEFSDHYFFHGGAT